MISLHHNQRDSPPPRRASPREHGPPSHKCSKTSWSWPTTSTPILMGSSGSRCLRMLVYQRIGSRYIYKTTVWDDTYLCTCCLLICVHAVYGNVASCLHTLYTCSCIMYMYIYYTHHTVHMRVLIIKGSSAVKI